ncbi:DUF6496 domain-containing protein [Peredibacter sp. HCB2-198]|uniref:DUF6496 domain-containing protein n=1 Tax=Peredibacter sp. HCB2-198 TaxID=3383025 RepID=UPI0038B6948C
MPERKTIKRAQKDKREGKSASTQAGEFVKDEIERIREGKTGARNTKQAIAIGLSKARKAGVDIPDKTGKKSSHRGRIAEHKTSRTRSEAGEKRQKKESKNTVSHKLLSLQAKRAQAKRGAAARHRSAVKAAHTRAEHKKAA